MSVTLLLEMVVTAVVGVVVAVVVVVEEARIKSDHIYCIFYWHIFKNHLLQPVRSEVTFTEQHTTARNPCMLSAPSEWNLMVMVVPEKVPAGAEHVGVRHGRLPQYICPLLFGATVIST